MNSILAVALSYAARGWFVFPVRGKLPMTPNGFKDATTDPEVIRAWWTQWPEAGVAIATGRSGVWALDVDPKNGGPESLAQLTHDHGELPDTLVSLTGSGGLHALFTGDAPCTAGRVAPGIDTRGSGGYIVAPPSPHPSGGVYAWHNPESPIAAAPDWLMELVGQPRVRAPAAPVARPRDPAPPSYASAARSALQRHGPAREGHGGDRHTFVACAIVTRDFPELNDDQRWALITEWNQTCVPPWPLDDLRTKLDNADAYATGEPLLEVYHSDEEAADFEFPVDVRCTDLGNALRLERRHGEDLRYVHDWGTWLVWDAKRWALSDTGQHMRKAVDAVVAMEAEVHELQAEINTLAPQLQALDQAAMNGVPADPRAQLMRRQLQALQQRATSLGKWALQSQASARLDAMVKVAETRPKLALVSTSLDANPMLLGVANGTVDLTDGALRPAARDDHITKLSPVAFDPEAQAPTWQRFLDEIMLGDAELVRFLQLSFGYTLTGRVDEQVFWFLHGDGANGKSVFLNAMLYVMGEHGKMGAKTLLEEDHSGNRHTTDMAELQGARAVILSETEESKGMPEASIKRLTGGEPITARRLYRDNLTFQPTHKLWVAGNYKPEIRGSDYGIWRRIRCVPFRHTVSDGRKDPKLFEKLKAEGPGILAWAVRGALAWQKEGLHTPTVVAEALTEYKAEQDVVGQFLGERTEKAEGAKVQAQVLYNAYREWSQDNGYRWPMTIKKFRANLTRRGYVSTHSKTGKVWQDVHMV